VADYGHGLLGGREAEHLAAHAPFLAVNTQLNADNAGYNTLSKYPRADYACLHEGEIRLDARDAHGDLGVLLRRARERTGAAVLALSSAAMRVGASPAVVNVLANLAGAQAVSYIGNQASIRKAALLAQLDRLGSDARSSGRA